MMYADKIYVGYIYQITNHVNDKVYIGQTTQDPSLRWEQHISALNSKEYESLYLYRAMKHYGVENFEFSVLERAYASTKRELQILLNGRETAWIKKMSTHGEGGYNLTDGGQTFSNPSSRAVFKVLSDGFVDKRYESLRQAGIENGINEDTISHACYSKSHYGKGYIWYFDDNTMKCGMNIGKQHRASNGVKGKSNAGQFKCKPVNLIDEYGRILERFNSVSEACDHCHISRNYMYRHLVGKYDIIKGQRFKFA